MKIVCFNHKLYYINTGIFEALKEMGHQVEIIALSQFASIRQKEILEDILTGLKPDIIFTPGWSINFFDTDQYLDIVKKSGIPHVYWATEDPLFIDDVSMVFCSI